MPRANSKAKTLEILRKHQEGITEKALSELVGIEVGTVQRLMVKLRKDGHSIATTRGTITYGEYAEKVTQEMSERWRSVAMSILSVLLDHPEGITIKELARKLRNKTGKRHPIDCYIATIEAEGYLVYEDDGEIGILGGKNE